MVLRWERKRASPSSRTRCGGGRPGRPASARCVADGKLRHRLLAVRGALGDVAVGGGIARGRGRRIERRQRAAGHRPGEHRVLAVARNAAGVAVAPLAVLGAHLLLRLDQLDLEPALRDRDVEDVPGQDLVEVVGAQVRLLRDALGLERLHPQVVAEVLASSRRSARPTSRPRAARAPPGGRRARARTRSRPRAARATSSSRRARSGSGPSDRRASSRASRRRRRAPTGTASRTSARRSRRRR